MRAFFETERGKRVAWYLYDFGNSAYAAVVILAIYPAFFKNAVVGGPEGTRLWGLANAVAMLVVTVISPLLGAIADHLAIKKRLLAAFTALACVATAMLWFVGKGDIAAGFAIFVIAEIGYRTAQIFYNAMLPEIADRSNFGRISGHGWAIGSIGGIVCLAIVLPMVVIMGASAVNATMVVTAVFFAVFSLPLFAFVKEKALPKPPVPGVSLWTLGFRQVWATLRKARHYRDFMVFLVAFIFLNDAVMIALGFAAIIGAVLFGFGQQQLILLIVLVQVTNVIGSWVFGYMSDRISGKSAMQWSALALAVSVVWMMLNDSAALFYVIASLAGFAIAGQQSVSRTLVAKLTPASQSGEFFGLFSVAGRSSSVIGPALFGWVAADLALANAASGMDALAAEQAGLRSALWIILGFLGVGSAIMAMVREEEAVFEEAAGEVGAA